ncbi:uncharacterized protein LOC111023353 [Momordica charantia]|uniref:Uncharacterized protein LOC111023353 n=1 Tax=Momordica charantia TaxID=3673 RepID=A0A6J1DQC8_MOMCH|nr:uncharacterized protein LOC111023353 [Momordica charantia]
MFRKTIFGHLLDVDLVFNGPLIHNILLREVEDSTPNTISFNLFGRRVSFGRREFDLISGLHYDRSPVRKVTHSHKLRTLYFNDRTNDVLSDFVKLYIAALFKDDFDVIKVSIIYMVELVLLGRETTMKFDQILLGVVDDWELCCNHDLASLSFDKTIRSLHRGPTNMAKDFGLRKSYSLYGFPWVFQVWTYERRTRRLEATDAETNFMRRTFEPPEPEDDDVRDFDAGPSTVREGTQNPDVGRGDDAGPSAVREGPFNCVDV